MLSELLKKSLPLYEINLPLSNKKHRFRPMTVKEEKNLLLAQSEGKSSIIAYSIKNILESCFEDLNNAENLDLIDVQTAFLNLRSRSIGDVFSFQMKCPETEENLSLTCTLADFKQNGKIEKNKKIKIDDDIILILKSPTLSYFIHKDDAVEDEIKDLFLNCFVEVQTSNNTIAKTDTSNEDILEFYDSLTTKQYSDIVNFFEQIPRLELVINYKTSDGVNRQVKFNGLDSFFELASAI